MGWVLDLVLLVLLISQSGSFGEALQTFRALTGDGLEAGRKRAAAFHRAEGYWLDSRAVIVFSAFFAPTARPVSV